MSIDRPESLPRKRGTVKFDPVLNWGHILIASTLVFSIAGVWANLKSDQGKLDVRVAAVESAQKTMAAAIIKLSDKGYVDSAQDAKINSIDSRVTRLEGHVYKSH